MEDKTDKEIQEIGMQAIHKFITAKSKDIRSVIERAYRDYKLSGRGYIYGYVEEEKLNFTTTVDYSKEYFEILLFQEKYGKRN